MAGELNWKVSITVVTTFGIIVELHCKSSFHSNLLSDEIKKTEFRSKCLAPFKCPTRKFIVMRCAMGRSGGGGDETQETAGINFVTNGKVGCEF